MICVRCHDGKTVANEPAEDLLVLHCQQNKENNLNRRQFEFQTRANKLQKP
jgi:hypothetical protein